MMSQNALGSYTGRHDIFWCLGDSICAGTSAGLVTAPYQPISGTAIEYDSATQTLLDFGTGPVAPNFADNKGSPWASFCERYYSDTNRNPVIVNRGAGSSTLSTADNNNDWQVSGTNWVAAVAALQKTRVLLPGAKVKAVFVNLMINDVQGLNATSGLTVAQIKTSLYEFIDRVIAVVGPGVPIVWNTLGRWGGGTVHAKLSGCRNSLRSACIDYTNVHIGATLSSFQVSGYYVDNIHPGPDGNAWLGKSFARWFQNNAYTKWARSIISVHEGPLSTAEKDKIQVWITANQTVYLQMEYFYGAMGGPFQRSTGYNACLDWCFMSAPSIAGGFTVGGTAPNYYCEFDGVNDYFDDGNQQNISNIYATNNDFAQGISIVQAVKAAGTAAYAFGRGLLSLNQSAGSTTEFNCFGATGDAYGTDTKLQVANYFVAKDTVNILLYKNGTAVAGGARAAGALSSANTSVGALNASTVWFSGRVKYIWRVKYSAISAAPATWQSSLDTLYA